MRKVKTLVLLLLFSAIAFGQSTVTVSANLKTIFAANQATRAKVCFSLVDATGQAPSDPPHVVGTGVLIPISAVCANPDANGLMSTSLYANDAITAGGVLDSTLWSVTYLFNGSPVHGAAYHFKTSDVTENLNTLTPANITPLVVATPTDAVYARLDGGNSPFTAPTEVFNNNVTVGGLASFKNLEGCKIVDTANSGGWAGSDYGAWVTAALTAAGAEGCVAVAPGSYTQSTTATMSVPATLVCLVPGTCIINATAAVTTDGLLVGPNGLTSLTYDPHEYHIGGFAFTGGSAWADGIRVNKYVVKSYIGDNIWFDAGNATGWNVKYQSQNWDSTFEDNYMWSTAAGTCYNGVLLNGYDTDNTTADNGQSFLYMLRNHIQTTNSCATTGVIIDGFNSVMEQGNVAGFNPLIRVRQWGNNFQIKGNSHFEEVSTAVGACAIQYGDINTDPGASVNAYISGLTIENSTVNVHNSSFTTTGHPICPATATTGIINTVLNWLYVIDITNGQPVVVQNNNTNQTGNRASNTGYLNTNGLAAGTVFGLAVGSKLHTQGASITSWDGTDENLSASGNITATGTIIALGAGTAAAPAVQIGTSGTNGFWDNGGHSEYTSGGTSRLGIFNSILQLPSAGILGWSGSTINAADTSGLSQVTSNVIGVGNGGAGDVSGEIRSARISATYNAAGTLQTTIHFVKDTCTLGTNCNITLTGSAAFSSGSSYDCFPRDATTAANAVTVTRTSGSALAFTGTGTDVINYVCVGN